MPKTWTALGVTVAPEMADAVGSFLIDQGAPGLQNEEADGLVRVTGYFAGPPPLAALEAHCKVLAAELPGGPAPRIRVESITEEVWGESWKEHFPPLVVGRRLFVHPPWVSEIPAGRTGIVIDPGMAFGTGHHASTRGCLTLLEAFAERATAPRVLDVGTGSGILAIAAEKLGARLVVAIDIDPEAREVTSQNAIVNRAVRIRIGDSIDAVHETFDIIVANLLAGPLIELSARLHELLAPAGVLIGSGMLREESHAVAEAWKKVGLVALERYEEEGWTTLAHRRAESPA
jgi:ribosomal protein L11 methyltransferase